VNFNTVTSKYANFDKVQFLSAPTATA